MRRIVPMVVALLLASVTAIAEEAANSPCPDHDRACLLAALNGSDMTKALQAVMPLVLYPDEEVTTALASRLTANDRMLATASLHALEKMGPTAAKALAPYTRSTNPQIRGYAIYGLAEIGEGYTAVDIHQLATDKSSKIRRDTADAAAALGAEGDPTLKVLTEDRAINIRAAAVEALGWIDHPDAIKEIAFAMGDLYPEVGDKAVYAMIAKGSAAVPELKGLLRSGKPYIQDRAAYASAQIGDPGVNPELVALLNSRDESVVKAGLYALSITGDRSVLLSLRAVSNQGRVIDGMTLGMQINNVKAAIEKRGR
jgi:HEAT repeat protein